MSGRGHSEHSEESLSYFLKENVGNQFTNSSFLAILAPIVSTVIVFLIRKRIRRLKSPEIGAYTVGAVGLVAYTYYAINGQTDPNTSAHMHVICFPLLYFLFSLLVMIFSIGIGVWRSDN